MRYLVTGGAGFIGSHLCDALVDSGHDVTCLDSLLTGRMENVDHLMSNPLFSFVHASACNGLVFNVDGIFHLASPTAPVDSNKYEGETINVNSIGTRKLIQMAKRHRSKFLFASSVKVLGECNRVKAYIAAKRLGEKICIELGNKIGAKVARLASVYGPRMRKDDSRVIPVFIDRATRGEPLSVWNGGTQVDSFCYVSDIVDGLIRFMESEEPGVVEFGYPNGVSIISLAHIIKRLTGSQSPIYKDEKIEVVEECHKVVNISAAMKILGWQPKVDLETGLLKMIERWPK
jgi:nucleoside-diphosphate-sugar epimerase